MSADRLHSQATDAAKPARRLAFSTPMGVSAVAVVAVAIIAGLLLFGPRGLFGLGLTPSPTPVPTDEPTTTQQPTVTPTAEPTALPTVEPTPSVEPTPMPVAAWTGLEWSEPILRSEGEPWLSVIDAVRWDGGYAGVGEVIPADATPNEAVVGERIPVFLWSDDGINWGVVQELAASMPRAAMPGYVVASDDRLLAMAWNTSSSEEEPSSPNLWYSDDGRTWMPIDGPSWRAGWPDEEQISIGANVAGGSSGFVAIHPQSMGGCCIHPAGKMVIGHSADGHAWTWLADAPVFADASFNAVEATPGGFVLVGRTGESIYTNDWVAGRPAAWFSADGVSWFTAEVEGPEVVGGHMSDVLVGAEGLFGVGVATPDTFWWERTSAWASVDGRTWTLVEGLDSGLLNAPIKLSDGNRMVIVGRENLATSTPAGWTSSDGVTWNRLAFSGSPPVPRFDGYYTNVEEEPHDPGYWGDTAKLSTARLQDSEVVGYGSVATGSDPAGTWTEAKWIATVIER